MIYFNKSANGVKAFTRKKDRNKLFQAKLFTSTQKF